MKAADINIQELLDAGLRCRGRGDLQAAARAYRQVLSHCPDNAQALDSLGVVADQAGNLAHARELIQRAIAIDPGQATYHQHLGNVCKHMGKLDLAKASLLHAVSLRPDNSWIHYDLGIVYQIGNRWGQALASYRAAVQCDPQNASAWNNMGLVYLAMGERVAAIDCFETAIAEKTDFAGAYNNLAMVFVETGQFQKTISLSRKAIALDPNGHAGFHNMGNALLKKDLNQQAISCFRQGLERSPDHPEILNSLGVAYQKDGQPEQAIACFKKVVGINPKACKSYIHLYNQLRQICDWSAANRISPAIDSLTRESLKSGDTPVEPPFMSVCRDMNESRHFQIARQWSRDIEKRVIAPRGNHRSSFRKKRGSELRIGYLTNNFRNHPTTHLMCRLFGLHDRQQFHVHAYSCSQRSSNEYAKIVQENCDAFTQLFLMSDQDAAEKITADGIDILVDLNGYTDGHRMEICAQRPAPVQVRYLGMAGTTAASFFDYLIGDRIITPETSAHFYSEKFVYMPHTYQANSYRFEKEKPIVPGEGFRGSKDRFTYCCFSSNYKFEERVFNVWMRILKRVPASELLLLSESKSVSRNLRRAALAQGVDPDRLRFAGKKKKQAHLQRLQDADVALDTSVVNGAATTSDALWAGVPVVTLQGEHFASRMSASILKAMGLTELITHSLEQYEDLAVALATRPERLNRLREEMVRKRQIEPLFDTPRFVRNLENAFLQMWTIHEAGQAPRPISVHEIGID